MEIAVHRLPLPPLYPVERNLRDDEKYDADNADVKELVHRHGPHRPSGRSQGKR